MFISFPMFTNDTNTIRHFHHTRQSIPVSSTGRLPVKAEWPRHLAIRKMIPPPSFYESLVVFTKSISMNNAPSWEMKCPFKVSGITRRCTSLLLFIVTCSINTSLNCHRSTSDGPIGIWYDWTSCWDAIRSIITLKRGVNGKIWHKMINRTSYIFRVHSLFNIHTIKCSVMESWAVLTYTVSEYFCDDNGIQYSDTLPFYIG